MRGSDDGGRRGFRRLLRDLATIVFDFDGTILESAGIKTSAFRDIFARYPEHVDAIVAYHRQNAGMGRIEKLRIIYRDILKAPLSPTDEARLGQEFADYVFERVLACPLVPGALECLTWCAERYQLFVASGVPESELRDIVQRRDLAKLFASVYGSPRNKVQILGDIQREHGWERRQMLMVGDALTDSRAAVLAGTAFVGRVAEGDENIFVDQPNLGVVRDLSELLADLREQ
jgi:phosphoglycolate phosphatase-like HAD superfamily hydrolase